jgi:hypothetical protein
MRSYPRNSPEAAGRLVALVLLSDGHVCRSELDALERLDAAAMLGLAPDALPKLVHTLCEDLLMSADTSGSMLAGIDEPTLDALMAEIDDPALQRLVLHLALAVVGADRHLCEGESRVLDAALRCWGLSVQTLRAAPESLAA